MSTPTTIMQDGRPVPVEALLEAAPFCLICHAPSEVAGVFEPTSDEYKARVLALTATLGRPKNAKRRCLVYGLCLVHAYPPNAEMIERLLLGHPRERDGW